MSEAQQAAAGANIGTTPTTDSDYLDAEQRATLNLIASQPTPPTPPAPTVIYYDYPDAPTRQAINTPPIPIPPPVDLTGPAAVQQYATPAPPPVDLTGPAAIQQYATPQNIELVGVSPDALAGYGTTAPPAVLTDTQIKILEDEVAAAVDAGTISEAVADKYYAEVESYKVQRDQALENYQADQVSTKWSVEVNGVNKTFDSYEEAMLASVKAQKVTMLDASGESMTFDSLDDAHRFIERQNEDYIKAQRYADMTPTFGVGAWNLSADDLLKNVEYMGQLIDEEAENQKLYGNDVLAGVLYSTGRAYRLGTGLIMGPALLPQTIYTLVTDPGAVVNAMARDPIVAISNIALLGLGISEAYSSWKAGVIGRNIKWASKLDDIDFMPTEPGGGSVGGVVPRETFTGGYETLDFAAMEKYIKGETVTGFAKDTLYGPNKDFIMEGMKPIEVFKGKINPSDFEAGAFDYGGYGVKEPYPSVWEYYGSAEAIKSLFGESPLKVQPSGIRDIGVVTSERVINAETPWLEAEKPYFEKIAGKAEASKMSGLVEPIVPGGEYVSPEGTVSVSQVAEPFPVYGGGQLPNPYYNTPVGMVTSGIPLVGPGPLFYASVASLLSSTPNAPSPTQIIPQISITIPKIIANLNTREVQPILNLIDTALLPKINTIISLTPTQTPSLDINSINDQISRIEPIQAPIQIPMQIPVQEPYQAPIQEPLMEPIQEPVQELFQETIQIPEPIIPESYPPKPVMPTPKKPKPVIKRLRELKIKEREVERGEVRGVQRFRVRFDSENVTVEARGFNEALSKAQSSRRTRGSRVVEVVRLGEIRG